MSDNKQVLGGGERAQPHVVAQGYSWIAHTAD